MRRRLVREPGGSKTFAEPGAHVVGQTLGHEETLMRLGIHFASLNIVSSRAEGAQEGWIGDGAGGMSDFYFACAPIVGSIMADALKGLIREGPGTCNCDSYYLDRLNAFPAAGV